MSTKSQKVFASLYARFQAPISRLNCGHKCAPYNERGVPFCCDTGHMIPTAYQAEWDYLESSTDLWHRWETDQPELAAELQSQAPSGQVLIACQGHDRCQRGFRSITCRAFPFFPYINSNRVFQGLSYYWQYEDRCWVISNLQIVDPEFRAQFIRAFDVLLQIIPEELENFAHFSGEMRAVFKSQGRAIPLLHRNGHTYKISPRNERMRRIPVDQLPEFGPYKIASRLPFADEDID